MQLLLDPTGEKTFQEVADAVMQAMPGDSLTTGYTKSVIWLRLSLNQPVNAAGSDWRLLVDNVQVNDIRFYLRSPDGTWLEQRAGRNYPHDVWPIKTRAPVFTMSLEPGTYQVLLRIQGGHTLSGAISLWSPRNFADFAISESFGFGAYFGAFFVHCCCSSFSGWLARSRVLVGTSFIQW
ncbi:7TMR-DISMED2 domain-containing protein [Variovorax sp. HJSM1_2]|uniref:7TMR-DISMED2 domain-containing protein n=1 Tax=Variovorax sp. HJSM1_2 TaxID=3366263 RepID=UPI003BD51A94